MEPLSLLITFLILILVFLISAIPLYLSVKFLGGKTTLLKTALVSLLAAIVVAVVNNYFKVFGGIIAFILMIWIYREMFKLKWIKALLAWALQFVILFILIVITLFIASLLGISIPALFI